MSRGKLITLEGMDGAGKSTHVGTIADFLKARGKDVVLTREPGGTSLGEKLRTVLLSEKLNIDTETLLMFAARREHIAQVIGPGLAAGRWVISDRFTDATYDYQGAGGGMAMDRIAALDAWVSAGLKPDLTLVFDVPVEVALGRLPRTSRDRFESENKAYFERVRAGYLQRAKSEAHRMRVIDAQKTVPEVKKEVEDILITLC